MVQFIQSTGINTANPKRAATSISKDLMLLDSYRGAIFEHKRTQFPRLLFGPQGKNCLHLSKYNHGLTASSITTETLMPKERRWLSEQVCDWKMQTMPFLFLQPLMALHKSPWLQSDEGLRKPPSIRARPCALWNAFGSEWQQTLFLTAGTTADIILYQTTIVKQAKWKIYKLRHANWLLVRSEYGVGFKCIIHCHWQG